MVDLRSDHLGHAIAQIGWPERLGHEIVCTAFLGLYRNLRLGMGGENEDLGLSCGVIGADASQHFPAVHAGEADIEDDRRGKSCPGCLEARYTVGSSDDIQAQFPQAHFDEAANARRVFHNQD